MQEEQLIQFTAENEEQSRVFAKQAVRFFKVGDTVLLYGCLGSGKTFLVREFVRVLGVTGEVTSPTFTIINQYSGIISINHIDLYRISNENELINLGLEDLWQKDCLIFIEWPQLIENRINEKHYRLYISGDPLQLHRRCFLLCRYQ